MGIFGEEALHALRVLSTPCIDVPIHPAHYLVSVHFVILPTSRRSLNGQSAVEQLAGRQPLSDGSRSANVLTIMMTDVVGSTALRRTRGDRDADDMLGVQAAIVREQVTVFGGQVRKSLGDGFLISFPTAAAAVNPQPPSRMRCLSTTPPIRSARSRSALASTPAKSPRGWRSARAGGACRGPRHGRGGGRRS